MENEVTSLFKDYSPIIPVLGSLLSALLVGIWFNSRLEQLKSRLQLDHSIIKKRADFYAEIQNDLNYIYSYIKRVGRWKELTPGDVLESKRIVDQRFHTTRPFWSEQAFSAYEHFMDTCFKTYRAHGLDAGIIADITQYQDLPTWKQEYTDSFEQGFELTLLEGAYLNFMEALSKDFGTRI